MEHTHFRTRPSDTLSHRMGEGRSEGRSVVYAGISTAACAAAVLICLICSQSIRAELEGERHARMAWWTDARFGMFIHWGPVSLKGTEIGWSRGREVPVAEYDQLYRGFNPVKFSARDWVTLAKESGMKYLVLTSKHHDGFCLWESRQTDYTITSTPFQRDVVKELAIECQRQDIVFCLYHSIADWHHPDYLPRGAGDRRPESEANFDRYRAYLKAQLRELLTGYGPLGILWFDGEWERAWTHEHALDLDAFLRRLQPSLIINNRIDKGRRDMEGTTAAGEFLGDYDTPEQRIGKFQNTRPWESCITLGQQWAWKPNDQLKSASECVRTLIHCAGGDGNLLLNIGPMPNGEVEPRQVETLRAIGQWLRQFGQCIYGTRGGPFLPGQWGASTHRGNTLYVQVFQWPSDGLRLPAIKKRILSGRALAGGKVEWSQTPEGISIQRPHPDPTTVATVIELQLDGPAEDIPPTSASPPILTPLTERP